MSHAARSERARQLLLALLAFSALPAVAAPSELGVAFEQAWARAPHAAALDAREAETRAAREVAEGLTPEPGALSLGSLNDRIDAKRGKQEYEIEFAVPLWLPGQRTARLDEAGRQIDLLAAQRAAWRLELAGELREAWWTLAQARGAASLAQRRLETARALENDVLRRFAVGELSRIDANLARSETRAADAEAIEADLGVAQAEQSLRVLLGAPAPATLGDETPPPPLSGGSTTGDPLAAHPALTAVAAAAQAARARLRVADASPRAAPELALRVVRERGEASEAYAHTVGLRLTIPFSSAALRRQESAAVRAEVEQNTAELQRAQMRVRLEAERAERILRAAESQLALAEERRQLASENLRLGEKAFALGESDLANLLRIRAAAFDAEAAAVRQRVARAAAVSRLNQALGVLP